MNKEQIMNGLYERDYLRQAHDTILTGLIGSFKQEYIMSRCPEKTMTESKIDADKFCGTPIFYHTARMLVSMLLHGFAEKIAEEMAEVVLKLKEGESK